MRKRFRWASRCLILLVSAMILALGWLEDSASAGDSGPPDHARAKPELTGVTLRGLHPIVMRISSESTFGWLNYSSDTLRVSFDADVARKLTCKGPSSFRIRDGRLDSGEVRKAEFTSLCHLARGNYEYTVELSGKDGEPDRIHRGKIVVESPIGFVSFD